MRLFKHFEAWLLVRSVSQELNILLTRELDDVESKLNCADWGKLQGGHTLGYRVHSGHFLLFLSLYMYMDLASCAFGPFLFLSVKHLAPYLFVSVGHFSAFFCSFLWDIWNSCSFLWDI